MLSFGSVNVTTRGSGSPISSSLAARKRRDRAMTSYLLFVCFLQAYHSESSRGETRQRPWETNLDRLTENLSI